MNFLYNSSNNSDQSYDFNVRSKKSKFIIQIIDNKTQSIMGSLQIPIDNLTLKKRNQLEKDFLIESQYLNFKKQNPALPLRLHWKELIHSPDIPVPLLSDSFSLDSILEESVNPKYNFAYKVIVIGDSGVGKTNLLQRWIKNSFTVASIATINVDWSTKYFKVNDKIVQVTFCDTAGQERFKSLTRQYYRNAHGVVLVYDITERNSYRHIDLWLEEVKNSNSDFRPIILLIGNKNDLIEERIVTAEEALKKAKNEEIFFLETSALDGSNCAIAMQLILQYIHITFEKYQAIPEVPATNLNIGQSVKIGNIHIEPQAPATEESECLC